MMHLTVVAVGRLKERFWADACDEYLRRLGAYASVRVHELADVDPARAGGEKRAVEQEGHAILSAIDALPTGTTVILMDIQGREMTSVGIAESLEKFALDGQSDVCFVIGGSCGVSADMRHRAQLRWSLGRITLPHNLARVVVLEQLYRAFKIVRGEPYHK